MKRTLLIVALFAGILACYVGYSDSHYLTAIGRIAPAFSIGAGDSTVTLGSLRGNYVLVSFWKSTHAPSRQNVNLYTAWQRSHPDSRLKIININFDDDNDIFNEIVRRDGLVREQQYRAEGAQAKAISDAYGLDNGYGSVLIAPDGRIVAHNPDPDKLAAMVAGG